MLGLGGADQAPGRGRGRVWGLAFADGDRAPGEEGEAGLLLGGDRLLQGGQDLGAEGLGGGVGGLARGRG